MFLRHAARGICTRASLSGQFVRRKPYMCTCSSPQYQPSVTDRFFASPESGGGGTTVHVSNCCQLVINFRPQTFANDKFILLMAVTSSSLFQLRVPGKHCLDGNCTVGMTNEEFCEIPRTSWEWDIPDR